MPPEEETKKTPESTPSSERTEQAPQASPDVLSSQAAERQPEEEIRDSKAVLKTLSTLREENKRLQSIVKNVDIEEYQRLKQLEAEIAEQKKAAEEEELKKAQKWEELTERKVAEIEQQYLKKIEQINNQYNQTSSQLQEVTQAKQEAERLIDEYGRRQDVLDAFLLAEGKKEHFDYVWKGQLRERTFVDEDGNLKITKAPGSNELELDEEGNPLTVSAWMEHFRASGGGIFFNPISNAAGSGTSGGSSKPTKVKPLVIKQSEMGNMKAMLALKEALGGEDPVRAIASGKVIVH